MNRTNAEGQSLLIKNGQIFDGVSDRLRAGHVLISERTIAAIDASPIAESDSMTVMNTPARSTERDTSPNAVVTGNPAPSSSLGHRGVALFCCLTALPRLRRGKPARESVPRGPWPDG
jgi:hypothetical protein